MIVFCPITLEKIIVLHICNKEKVFLFCDWSLTHFWSCIFVNGSPCETSPADLFYNFKEVHSNQKIRGLWWPHKPASEKQKTESWSHVESSSASTTWTRRPRCGKPTWTGTSVVSVCVFFFFLFFFYTKYPMWPPPIQSCFCLKVAAAVLMRRLWPEATPLMSPFQVKLKLQIFWMKPHES